MKISSKRGFTLIELLMVIVIIGIMASIVMALMTSAKEKSRDARRERDIHEIQTALGLYYTDNHGYPVASSPVVLNGTDDVSTALVSGGHIREITGDPRGTGDLVYSYESGGTDYVIEYCLENTNQCVQVRP